MSDQRLFELFSRKLAGEATPEELEEFESMVAGNPEVAERFRLLQLYWDQAYNNGDTGIEESLSRLMGKEDFSKPDNTS